MTIEDVAKLVSPRKPKTVVQLLKCFRDNQNPTIDDLMITCGESEEMTRYYLTKMRKLRLLESRRVPFGGIRYALNPRTFKTKVEDRWMRPLERLISSADFDISPYNSRSVKPAGQS